MSLKTPGFKFKFDDLVRAVFRRATVLRASGAEVKAPRKMETAKIAATSESAHRSYGNALKDSPQRTQHKLPTRASCSFCNKSHESVKCADFLALSVQKRHEEIRGRNLCFRCLTSGHIARDCSISVECSKCKKEHLDVLHSEAPYSNSNQGTNWHGNRSPMATGGSGYRNGGSYGFNSRSNYRGNNRGSYNPNYNNANGNNAAANSNSNTTGDAVSNNSNNSAPTTSTTMGQLQPITPASGTA